MSESDPLRFLGKQSSCSGPEWPEFDADAGLVDLYARVRAANAAVNRRNKIRQNRLSGLNESDDDVARRLIASVGLTAGLRKSEPGRLRELIGATSASESGGSGPSFPIETLVSSHSRDSVDFAAEAADHRLIIDLCQEAHSVGEIAAHLKRPINTVQVMIDELRGQGRITVHPPRGVINGQLSPGFIEDVFSGLRGFNYVRRPSGHSATTATKIIVSGGDGRERSDFVGAVSEVSPVAAQVNSPDGSEDVSSVRLGRISLASDLILYLLDVPERDWYTIAHRQFMLGAVGAIVLVDPDRPLGSIRSINYFDSQGVPYVIAMRTPARQGEDPSGRVRGMLAINKSVPVIEYVDKKVSTIKQSMISLVDYVMRIRMGRS